MPEIIFKSECYLKKSYLDADGAKQVTFEFPLTSALEVAKLELMAREGIRPVLLAITIKRSPNAGKEYQQKLHKKGKQKYSIGSRKSADA